MAFSSSLFGGVLLTVCGIAGTAHASPPQTSKASVHARLVHCAADTCLLVTGRRSDAAAAVAIAGRVVAVDGRRSWRVEVPVSHIRDWSAPFARTIAVSITEPDASPLVWQAKLPIGLLGHTVELASLAIGGR